MAGAKPKLEIYQRAGGKWAWRLKAGNGEIVATDAGQGYENKSDAKATGEKVASGGYSDYELVE